jgi:hypothetical protein
MGPGGGGPAVSGRVGDVEVAYDVHPVPGFTFVTTREITLLRHRCEHLVFLVFFLRFWLGPGYPVDVGLSRTARVGEVSSLNGVHDAEKYCS